MNKIGAILVLIFLAVTGSDAQDHVFALLKKEETLAQELFNKGKYSQALELFRHAADKAEDRKLFLYVARCHFELKEYREAAEAFQKYSSDLGKFEFHDLYNFGEALSSTQNYSQAIACYRQCLELHSGNDQLMKKIWQLTHRESLFEDTTHYAVRLVPISSGRGEFAPVYYKNGIAFVSDREKQTVIEKVNARTGSSFYKIFTSQVDRDTIAGETYYTYTTPTILEASFNKKLHVGPIAFYAKGSKCAFVATASKASERGVKTLQLFFAEQRNKRWSVVSSYPFNSVEYSITDPTLNSDGTILFFSSDMTGGRGGRDIYKSEFINGRWTPPVNLGDVINTVGDEISPYLHQDLTLYFASNGLPGLGGLDIFKSIISPGEFDAPQNVGAPINSSFDDFGILIDSLNSNGYFSSNRKSGGYDDDLYELSMDLQAYPVTVAGVVKYKEHTWSDASELMLMPHARIALIDKLRNATVYETTTDGEGGFSIIVPYFSKYIVRIVSIDGDENLAVLEIPKQKKEASTFEIVVIKDFFKELSKQQGSK